MAIYPGHLSVLGNIPHAKAIFAHTVTQGWVLRVRARGKPLGRLYIYVFYVVFFWEGSLTCFDMFLGWGAYFWVIFQSIVG